MRSVPDRQADRGADPGPARYRSGEGGLGAARPEYPNDLVADAATAVFTVNAGGLNKTVSIYALGLEMEDDARSAGAQPRSRSCATACSTSMPGGAFETADYAPERYRGVLLEGQPGAPEPEGLAVDRHHSRPTSSRTRDPNAFQLPARVMTTDEVERARDRAVPGRLPGPDADRPRRRQVLLVLAPPAPPRRGQEYERRSAVGWLTASSARPRPDAARRPTVLPASA